MELRQYQNKAIQELRLMFKSGFTRIMLHLPVGSGKTEIASEMIKRAVERGNRSLFICERISLVEQAAIRFASNGLHVGITQGDHPGYDPGAPVQCASVQTLARRMWPHADIIFFDEAHILHKTHKEIIERWPSIPLIGLSATPFSKGLGKYFQGIVSVTTASQLIGEGHLVEPIVYGPVKPNMDGVRTVRGDFDEKASELAAMPLIGDVVYQWMGKGENRPTAMFCVNIAHSKALVKRFMDAGVSAEHVDAYTDSEDRREIFKRFDQGVTRIISSVDVIGRGWDQPKVSCLCLCRPTKSLIVHIQQIGRGMRPHESKKDVIVLDFAGNHERLGFCTDPLPNHLDMGNKAEKKTERKDPLPKPCPKCSFIKLPKITTCPRCGFKPERVNEIEHAEGDLSLISKRNRDTSWETKINFMGQLKTYCAEKGKKDGWAAWTYKNRYGVFPNDSRLRNALPAPVTQAVANYIHSRNIAWAKSKR